MERKQIEHYTFSSVEKWFERHPGMSTEVPQSIHELELLIRSVCDRYIPQCYQCRGAIDQGSEEELVSRLLTSLLYHWEQAGVEISSRQVADSLCDGRGFMGNGQLNGNPLEDLVLVQGLCDRQALSKQVFDRIAFSESVLKWALATELVIKTVSECSSVEDGDSRERKIQYYSELLIDFLVSGTSTNPSPLIKRYIGLSGFQRWLRIVLVNRLRSIKKEQGRLDRVKEKYIEVKQARTDAHGSHQTLEFFHRLAREALDLTNMTPADKLRIQFHYEEKMTLGQTAVAMREPVDVTESLLYNTVRRLKGMFFQLVDIRKNDPGISESVRKFLLRQRKKCRQDVFMKLFFPDDYILSTEESAEE